MPNPTDSSPLTSSPDLAIDFCGVRCANPFILASSPVAHNYEMCVRALEAGWAGICFKTISFYPSHEVSPRFDQMEVDGVPFIGFKNMEQLSEASVEENFDTLYRLKQRYPDKLIISSIMGRTDDEWTRLAQYSTQAGADIIECNFSCPQMTQEGMGSDVGQSPELVRRFTAATRRGTHLPILAKMTPNIGQMTPVALAAHEGGATGIAAINTIKCITRIDEKALTARPVVAKRTEQRVRLFGESRAPYRSPVHTRAGERSFRRQDAYQRDRRYRDLAGCPRFPATRLYKPTDMYCRDAIRLPDHRRSMRRVTTVHAGEWI